MELVVDPSEYYVGRQSLDVLYVTTGIRFLVRAGSNMDSRQSSNSWCRCVLLLLYKQLRPRQNICHFGHNILCWLHDALCLIQVTLEYVDLSPINLKSLLIAIIFVWVRQKAITLSLARRQEITVLVYVDQDLWYHRTSLGRYVWFLVVVNGTHLTRHRLTHWGWDKMATTFQILSNAFSCI